MPANLPYHHTILIGQSFLQMPRPSPQSDRLVPALRHRSTSTLAINLPMATTFQHREKEEIWDIERWWKRVDRLVLNLRQCVVSPRGQRRDQGWRLFPTPGSMGIDEVDPAIGSSTHPAITPQMVERFAATEMAEGENLETNLLRPRPRLAATCGTELLTAVGNGQMWPCCSAKNHPPTSLPWDHSGTRSKAVRGLMVGQQLHLGFLATRLMDHPRWPRTEVYAACAAISTRGRPDGVDRCSPGEYMEKGR